MVSFQLFDPKSPEYEVLQNFIAEVEFMVLDPDQLEAGYSLYDIEMCMESLPDFYAFFERSDGTVITKFDIERKLNNIKSWIYSKVREKSVGRRFQRYR
jgi:hypothetical protein